MNKEIPPLGAYVIDTRTDEVGQVITSADDLLRLRPPGGGAAWDCPVEATEVTTLRVYLRLRVIEANRARRLV
ncbi:hypothetical protein B7P34_29455 [Streptosporangium nondiastaticum]|uniref:Uncharacterized protein n=2 Tax=Actinomycetes TaxID=1760 RepID=A0A9X7JK73_9ACTN|nr:MULTISPECIES: hypothetical protein [Actinomycetes]PSJ25190.1 hypothetical protein B7P34_29455 [Streptosporangium nondiastaticum]WKU45395.1 hypothetical protein Q3V23_15720 [Streptomyces sp. VNUA116]